MNIKFIAATVSFFLASTFSLLSSELPPCDQSESPTTYNDCFGSLELKGNIYIGEWKNGVAHGNGEYISSNGDHYFGAYKNGQRNGQGVYKFPGGNVYIGFFLTEMISALYVQDIDKKIAKRNTNKILDKYALKLVNYALANDLVCRHVVDKEHVEVRLKRNKLILLAPNEE